VIGDASWLDKLLDADATQQRAKLRDGTVHARDLLEATLNRIANQNPTLNAIVRMDVEGARRAAAVSDARLAAGQPRTLEGLVVTVKDAFDVAGLVNSAGSPQYAARIPQRDASAVARLREAGAVILGKTNVSEMLGDLQGFNPVYGMTRNPHDPERAPGGSSAGSAVAVATGMAAFDLGSDLCGSIRWPAHCCGVFGFKPSYSAIPMHGHVPPPPGSHMPTPFSTGGPFARSARDIMIAFNVLADAPITPSLKKHLRVAIWADDPACPVDTEVAAAVIAAGEWLATKGVEIVKAPPPINLSEAIEVFSMDVHTILSLGLSADTRAALAAAAPLLNPADRSHEAMRVRAIAADIGEAQSRERRRNDLADAWRRFFTDVDCVLCPPAVSAAIPHDISPDPYQRTIDADFGRRPYFDLIAWSSPASVVGLPALVAPTGEWAQGLPLGVQIIGATESTVLNTATFFDLI